MSLADDLREHARATGIDLVGCTSPSPFLVGEEKREFDPRGVLPEAQAVVVAAPLLLGDEAYYRQALPEFPLHADIDTLRRNVAIALGNSGDPAAVPPLVEALGLEPPKVRGAVAWALGRLGGPDARDALRRAAETEQDETVREEVREALRSISTA